MSLFRADADHSGDCNEMAGKLRISPPQGTMNGGTGLPSAICAKTRPKL
jgi:hypothetical protein